MKFKRLLSLMLTIIMILSCSIDALAFTVNMNIDGDEVVQVQAGGNQFFNITFAPAAYEPNAEQVYTLSLGEELVFWRHSGTTGKKWDMGQWGLQDDAWVQQLMNGDKNLLLTCEWYLPDGVTTFLNNGGSWEDIKVTFQCKLSDGTPLTSEDIFKNNVVDCYITGNKIKAQFYPQFKTDTKRKVFAGNNIKLNRGIYPYSFTMFSMWSKDTTLHKHYGATRIWDREHGEPEYSKHSGFDTIEYSDILNTNGDLTPGRNLRNFEAGKPLQNNSGIGADSISTSVAKIGDGTFTGGGATGIGFNFPIFITFEINPNQTQTGNGHNLMYVSEYSIVNMADGADPDEMTTHASMQAYSNRAQ